MRLVDDAKKILLLSWSIRLSVLAAIAGTFAQLQQELPGVQAFVPAHIFGPISIACAVGAAVARLIKQERLGASQ